MNKTIKTLCMMRLSVFFLAAAVFAQASYGVVSDTVTESRDRMEPLPDELEGVDIVQKLNHSIPLELPFVDEDGRNVQLMEYFNGETPVILTLVYYRCPMLCGLVLNGMLDALREVDLEPGEEFEIVTVSIDPLETPKLAKIKKQNYIKELGMPEYADGWHFLTGREKDIRSLADSVGFGYKWIERRQEYAHGAAIMILTPDGRVSRYLAGIEYEPKTMRLSLVEASEGKIGTVIDMFILSCFQYNAEEGSYALVAMNVMRLGGFITFIILSIVLAVFWRREYKRSKLNTSANPA